MLWGIKWTLTATDFYKVTVGKGEINPKNPTPKNLTPKPGGGGRFFNEPSK